MASSDGTSRSAASISDRWPIFKITLDYSVAFLEVHLLRAKTCDFSEHNDAQNKWFWRLCCLQSLSEDISAYMNHPLVPIFSRNKFTQSTWISMTRSDAFAKNVSLWHACLVLVWFESNRNYAKSTWWIGWTAPRQTPTGICQYAAIALTG